MRDAIGDTRRWLPLLIWALGTLIAIGLIGDAPLAGLGVALLSGIAFGLANLGRFESTEKGKNH